MKRSCPGTSTTPARVAVRQIEMREAEIDRDAALLFFLEPVGVLTGERFDEAGLAVVDVSGGADDPVHATSLRSRRPRHVGVGAPARDQIVRVEDRPQVEQEPAVSGCGR